MRSADVLEATNVFFAAAIRETNVFYSNSNSFILGQLTILNGQLHQVQNDYSSYKSDAENQIMSLKQDNAQLTGEKDNGLLRITQLENMPQTALSAYTNALALSKMIPVSANFQFDINGKDLTNYIVGNCYIIPLPKNREIDLHVDPINNTEQPAENLTIDFFCALAPTNIVSGLGPGFWQQKPGSFHLPGSQPCCNYEIVSQSALNPIYGFDATPLILSTNFQGKVMSADIIIFSPARPGAKETPVNFTVAE